MSRLPHATKGREDGRRNDRRGRENIQSTQTRKHAIELTLNPWWKHEGHVHFLQIFKTCIYIMYIFHSL